MKKLNFIDKLLYFVNSIFNQKNENNIVFNAKNKNRHYESENIAKKIIELKNADFILRARLIQNAQHSEGYNEEMEALHNDNAKMLN